MTRVATSSSFLSQRMWRRAWYLVLVLLCASSVRAQAPLTAVGVPYTQDFDSLANSGTANATLPAGWALTESGGGARDNELYAADDGVGNSGDVYSYGASGSSDRAFGSLRSGSLVPIFGASFTNATGTTLTGLSIAYTGEQWRLGTIARTDRLDFQYSLSATSLTGAGWIDVDALDFVAPITVTVGAKDGNAAASRVTLSATIDNLAIPDGATIWIRWTDLDAAGADDGLAVDDFSLTPLGEPTGPPSRVTLTQSGGSTVVAEGSQTDSYTLVLTSQPTADVVVAITPDAQVSADVSSVTFTSVNWNVAQTVVVQAVDDTAVEPSPHQGSVAHVVTSSDAVYNGTPVPTLSISITDNDIALTPISQIQGTGAASPLAGQSVTTRGIVTAHKSNGFFVQSQAADQDADPSSSEGLFVFTGTALPAAAAVSHLVTVTGIVTEFRSATASPGSYTLTQLTNATVSAIATAQPRPAAVTLVAADLAVVSGLEKYEGMLVRVPSLVVVAPTGGTLSEANASSTSNGAFFGVLPGTPRPFREPGVEAWAPVPAPPAQLPRFDTNPERLRVDSDGVGGARIDVATGAVVSNLVGPLENAFTSYTLLPLPSPSPAPLVSGGMTVSGVPVPSAGEVTVGAQNFERFFDTVNDAGVSDVALTPAALATRLQKASLTVRDVLQSPDILAVVEFENLAVLQQLAERLNTDTVAAGNADPLYTAYLQEGNDIGGIDVGFLVKGLTTVTVGVEQI
ncbi:MAG: hypothetical protein H0V80_03395, partial [Acidobacteria bacterium]|nr:hypothetical protein [Acidobacteriota bacterium]